MLNDIKDRITSWITTGLGIAIAILVGILVWKKVIDITTATVAWTFAVGLIGTKDSVFKSTTPAK